MAVVQRNLLDLARTLEHKVSHGELEDADSHDLQTILERFMQLENSRQKIVKTQVAYQQRVASENPDKAKQKRSVDIAKAAEKYQQDTIFRERILQNKRLRYARKKEDME